MTHEIPEGWKIYSVIDTLAKSPVKKPKKLKTKDYLETGQYPVVDQGEKLICGYTDDNTALYSYNGPVVVFGDHTRYFKYVDFQFAIGADGTQILHHKDGFDTKFYYYALKNVPIPSEGYSRHFRFLKEKDIYVPPLPEQKKIAEFLSSVDEAIAATKAVIDQTKQVKKGLLQTLLTKGIGHTTFKQTPLGEIPESWEVKSLNECGLTVVDGDRGKAYPKAADFSDEGYCLFLSAKNITKNGFRWNECQFIGEERHNLLRKGQLKRNDIVLTTRGTVGNIGYFDETVPYDVVRINSGMVILRNDATQLLTDFVYMVLNSPVVRKQIDQLAFGSAQPQLTVKVINNFMIPIPPLEEQPKIIGILQDCYSALQINEDKLAQLQTLKSGLMSDLLTGRKRVEV